MRPQDPTLVASRWVTVDPEGAQRWLESLGGARPKLVDAPVRARIACTILVAEP